MLNVLDCSREGERLTFTFGTDGFADHAWHHTALSDPIVPWFDNVLLPLARKNGDALSVEDVVAAIADHAGQALLPLATIDWLGLALFASQRYREAAGRLAANPSPECQEECSATATLAALLGTIYERLAQAIHIILRDWPRHAA
jgi:hypothetical protein